MRARRSELPRCWQRPTAPTSVVARVEPAVVLGFLPLQLGAQRASALFPWQFATTVCLQFTFGTSLQIAISTGYRHYPARQTFVRRQDTALLLFSVVLVRSPPAFPATTPSPRTHILRPSVAARPRGADAEPGL